MSADLLAGNDVSSLPLVAAGQHFTTLRVSPHVTAAVVDADTSQTTSETTQ